MKMHQLPIHETRLRWSHVSQAYCADETVATPAAGRFIKGPIPLDWIGRAARLPGKALHVALALRYLAGLQKTSTVKLGAKALAALGVARDAKYRALMHLQQSNLIAVEQTPGRLPVVTLLDSTGQRGNAA